MSAARRYAWRRPAPLVGAFAVALAATVVLAAPAGATTYRNASLLTADGRAALGTSGSATAFSFSLTGPITCPTDSRHPPYYYVWGYMVPAATDVRAVMFRGRLIDLSKGFQLVEYGQPFGPYPVEANTGRLLDPGHDFSLKDFHASDLLRGGASSAKWQMGIACVPQQDGTGVKLGRPEVIWPVDIAVTASAKDPNGFTWRQVGGAHATSGSALATVAITGGLIVAFLIGSGMFVASRSGRRKAARASAAGRAPGLTRRERSMSRGAS